MIFFMAMPFVIGNDELRGAVAASASATWRFPTLNSVALGLTASGILLTNISPRGRRVLESRLGSAYPPLSELQFSPGVGVDYYLWALQISGVGHAD